jgi:diadenosine tetraphosphate (Ap4A) HIT family hydrolase
MANDQCPFCSVPTSAASHQYDSALAILDAFPVSEGHTLVVPRRHVASLFDLPEPEQAAVWKLVAHVRNDLQHDLTPDGFTIGINDGLAAGQTVMHGHVHVIPRRRGDVPDPRGGVRWICSDKAPYWLEGRR